MNTKNLVYDDPLAIPAFLRRSENPIFAEPVQWPVAKPTSHIEDKEVTAFRLQEAERRKAEAKLRKEEAERREANQKARAAATPKNRDGLRWNQGLARWEPDVLRPQSIPLKEAVAVNDEPAPTQKSETTRKRGNADEKHEILMKMLTRPEGCTKAEISAATEWLQHTAGARISGVKGTYSVTKTKEKDRGTVYRAKPKTNK